MINIEILKNIPTEERDVEIVERKGLGHPDTLIDGACEAVSRALSKFYLKEYDSILHYNVDKGLLVGGRSKPEFGGGRVIEPIYLIVAGRATSFVVRNSVVEPIPIGGITIKAIREYLKETLRFLDVNSDIVIDYKIKQGSVDLMSLRERGDKLPLCNDTSVGVGFAPLTPTERVVLETERYLNSKKVKEELKEVGEDIKVMALRKGKSIKLTVAAATISRLIYDPSHYLSIVEEVKRRVEDLASKITNMDVDVKVNSGDNYNKGIYYLTVTGTSAEAGDDGNTGRGNRPNGLITPMREYSMEATAGKNPINHTGKIFNVLAQKCANLIYEEVKGVKEVYVRILSRIGVPINQPQVSSVALILDEGLTLDRVKGDVESIIQSQLEDITSITKDILEGKATLF
ncbi:S-adenosylmethionine synthase [archaeon HR06]|nr:S-adenosylmethionine synthase [archaeon HR06]